MNTYCKLSASHKCENEAGLKHFIKHGEIHGCAGCCLWCKEKDTCEYRCVYVKGALTSAQETKPSASAFDFGADDQTNALLLQDAQTFITGNMARIMAAKHAHDLCANNKNGTWGKWCDVVGISRDTGDNMVHIAEQFGNIQIEGKPIFDVQPMKLLYAAAKSSAPQVLVEQVKTGDITTYKEYQDLLAQIKSKDAQLKAAHADISGLKDRATAAEAREEEAWQMQSKAEARAREAEKQLEGSRQVAQAAQLRAQKLTTENSALKSQPITAVVDKEEVRRQAQEMAHQAVQEAREQTAQAQARLDQYQQEAEGLLAPAQACAQQARLMADTLRAMYLSWFGTAVATGCPLTHMAAPLYAVCGQIMSSLEEESTIDPTAAGSVEDAEREALFE